MLWVGWINGWLLVGMCNQSRVRQIVLINNELCCANCTSCFMLLFVFSQFLSLRAGVDSTLYITYYTMRTRYPRTVFRLWRHFRVELFVEVRGHLILLRRFYLWHKAFVQSGKWPSRNDDEGVLLSSISYPKLLFNHGKIGSDSSKGLFI
jgi:hypothetical protein